LNSFHSFDTVGWQECHLACMPLCLLFHSSYSCEMEDYLTCRVYVAYIGLHGLTPVYLEMAIKWRVCVLSLGRKPVVDMQRRYVNSHVSSVAIAVNCVPLIHGTGGPFSRNRPSPNETFLLFYCIICKLLYIILSCYCGSVSDHQVLLLLINLI